MPTAIWSSLLGEGGKENEESNVKYPHLAGGGGNPKSVEGRKPVYQIQATVGMEQ